MKHFIQQHVGICSGLVFFVGMSVFYVWRGFHPVIWIVASALGAALNGVMMSMAFKAIQKVRGDDKTL